MQQFLEALGRARIFITSAAAHSSGDSLVLKALQWEGKARDSKLDKSSTGKPNKP